MKQKGFDYKLGNYLPVALEQYLLNYTNIKGIRLHLDNETGKECSKIIRLLIKEKYVIVNDSPTKFKDVNEMLIKNKTRHKVEIMK